MARRATFYEQSLANADYRLIVDAGAFGRGGGDLGRLRNEYMAKGLAMMGYQAINLSVRDLINGGEFIKKLAQDYGLKFISANIHYKDTGNLFTDPYTIIRLKHSEGNSGIVKTLKVGVLGLCEERSTLFSESFDEKELESRNPVEAAKKHLPKLRKKCDLVILLAHMNNSNLQKVLQELEGVDVIVIGGGYYSTHTGSELEKLIVVKTPSLGKYVGQLKLQIDRNKNIVSHKLTEIALNEKIADHPDLAKLAKEAEKAEAEYRKNRVKSLTNLPKNAKPSKSKQSGS